MDRLVLPYCLLVVAIVILLSTRGTAGFDIWFMRLVERPIAQGYHPIDYGLNALSQNLALVIGDDISASPVLGEVGIKDRLRLSQKRVLYS